MHFLEQDIFDFREIEVSVHPIQDASSQNEGKCNL
mgnify:CR=1 FL=1